MPITLFFAAILALFYIKLTLNVINTRKALKVAIGDGGNSQLSRVIRVHANFAEYVPLTLMLLYFLETQGAHFIVMQILGAALLIARVVHALGVREVEENLKYRVFGMFTNICIIVISSVSILLIGVGLV